MFEVEAADAKQTCLLWRAALLLWATVPAYLHAAFLGKRLTSISQVLASVVGIVGVLLPTIWALVWRGDFVGGRQDAGMLLLLVASIPLYMRAMRLARPSGLPGGLLGVWVWLVSLARLPPSWYGGEMPGGEREDGGGDKKGK